MDLSLSNNDMGARRKMPEGHDGEQPARLARRYCGGSASYVCVGLPAEASARAGLLVLSMSKVLALSEVEGRLICFFTPRHASLSSHAVLWRDILINRKECRQYGP